VTEPFAVVRIPPSSVLSYKNAPAIPASCLRVRHYNESHHNGIPRATNPSLLDDQTQEDDAEFALAFALSVQTSVVLFYSKLTRDGFDIDTGPLDWRASGMAIYKAYLMNVSLSQYSGKRATRKTGDAVGHSSVGLRSTITYRAEKLHSEWYVN
jgi:hypothetical protein